MSMLHLSPLDRRFKVCLCLHQLAQVSSHESHCWKQVSCSPGAEAECWLLLGITLQAEKQAESTECVLSGQSVGCRALEVPRVDPGDRV